MMPEHSAFDCFGGYDAFVDRVYELAVEKLAGMGEEHVRRLEQIMRTPRDDEGILTGLGRISARDLSPADVRNLMNYVTQPSYHDFQIAIPEELYDYWRQQGSKMTGMPFDFDGRTGTKRTLKDWPLEDIVYIRAMSELTLMVNEPRKVVQQKPEQLPR